MEPSNHVNKININSLPEEMLFEILKRVGFSCALACKQWHSLTQDPHFQRYAKSKLNKTVEITYKKRNKEAKINITVNGNDDLQIVKTKIANGLNILPNTITLNQTNITEIFISEKVVAQHTVRRQLFT